MVAGNRKLWRGPPRLRQRLQIPRGRPRAPRAESEGKKRKMSSSMAEPQGPITAVVTVSDSCARGEREDASGPAVAQLLQKLHFSVTVRDVVPDGSIQIQNLLIRLARAGGFVVTTGGTGIAARDVTPEATRSEERRVG